ncbi:phosphatidylinositol 4-kinase type 2-alpha isoform 2 [Platysternon megacephalum]|uniref:Phosphatidylinositol 4-kinase type 2-alpha isoform 2 n=2 Tax=Testudinoidea TaxID=8486 RepID=A0A4D9ENX6_9SAUR|nr:phosphatidylinositol 4-kinase type 2-alpha isoform 2 [Platysternon megacephalum]
MPSRKKTLMFASACFTSIWSFVIVCLVLANKNWVSSNVNFTEGNSSAIITVTYGVFEGVCSKKVIGGLETPAKNFQVTAKLGKTEMKSLNVVIILLLVLSLLSSLMSSGFTCCNTVTNPYQTFLGPIGVYTWNSLSGIFVLLTMILFAANVEANKLSVELASNCVFSSGQYKNSRNNYEYSYWLMLLIFLLNVATIIIIIFYHRARYSKRKEQERPIENAPKDGILF